MLDRECFKNIVKDAAMKKREKYENTLKKVEILKYIDPYEFGQICDDLKSVNYKAGDIIIKRNDIGDIFILLMREKCMMKKFLSLENPHKMSKIMEVRPFW